MTVVAMIPKGKRTKIGKKRFLTAATGRVSLQACRETLPAAGFEKTQFTTITILLMVGITKINRSIPRSVDEPLRVNNNQESTIPIVKIK